MTWSLSTWVNLKFPEKHASGYVCENSSRRGLGRENINMTTLSYFRDSGKGKRKPEQGQCFPLSPFLSRGEEAHVSTAGSHSCHQAFPWASRIYLQTTYQNKSFLLQVTSCQVFGHSHDKCNWCKKVSMVNKRYKIWLTRGIHLSFSDKSWWQKNLRVTIWMIKCLIHLSSKF